MPKDSFVYCWTDKLYNKLYVGVHKGTFDDGYICSSKLMKDEYKKRPEDFSRTIIAEGDYESMYKLESKILQSENVVTNGNYYNKACNNGYFKNKGKPLSQEHKLKIKNYFSKNDHPLLGKKHNIDSIKKMSNSRKKFMIENNDNMKGKNHPQYGKKQSMKHIENRIKHIRGKKRSEEIVKKVGNARSGVYEIITPDGEKIVIKNLASYCRKHNLHISNMFNRGKSKGYMCKNLFLKEIPNEH